MKKKEKISLISHDELMKSLYKKDKGLRKRLEAGVQRLKVIVQIIELREKAGLTQAQLAKRIGVSQPYIARIENDEASNLSLETLLKIAAALQGEVEIHIRPCKKAA